MSNAPLLPANSRGVNSSANNGLLDWRRSEMENTPEASDVFYNLLKVVCYDLLWQDTFVLCFLLDETGIFG